MFRIPLNVFRLANRGVQKRITKPTGLQSISRQFSALSIGRDVQLKSLVSSSASLPAITNNTNVLQSALRVTAAQPKRTLIKFSLRKGKRKSVKAVIKRFYRLDWGGWIRTRSGRNKRMWRKKESLRRRLRQHVFVNSTQAWMLDKMVTKFWRRPKYYVDDPYAPYHKRDEYYVTRRTPLKY